MNIQTANEILIHANRINTENQADRYEFVLNDRLYVVECMHVTSLATGMLHPVSDFRTTLQGVLFELNHVRVDPHKDNMAILGSLSDAFAEIGVQVHNIPSSDNMAVTYRPLGEIADRVRFHFTETGNCIFLCPNAKLKIAGLRR